MPLSDSDRDSLDRLLSSHDEDIKELAGQRSALRRLAKQRSAGRWDDPNPKPSSIEGLIAHADLLGRQIERHQLLVALGRDDRLRAALGELVDRPDAVVEAAENPRAYATKRGVDLPDSMEVKLEARDGHPWMAVVDYDRLVPFTLVWDDDGFRFDQ